MNQEIEKKLEQMFEQTWTDRLNNELQALRNTIIAHITKRYNAGQKFTHEDVTTDWNKCYFNDLSLIDCVFVLTINCKGVVCLASDYKSTTEIGDYEYYDELATLPTEELLYIQTKMHD